MAFSFRTEVPAPSCQRKCQTGTLQQYGLIGLTALLDFIPTCTVHINILRLGSKILTGFVVTIPALKA